MGVLSVQHERVNISKTSLPEFIVGLLIESGFLQGAGCIPGLHGGTWDAAGGREEPYSSSDAADSGL